MWRIRQPGSFPSWVLEKAPVVPWTFKVWHRAGEIMGIGLLAFPQSHFSVFLSVILLCVVFFMIKRCLVEVHGFLLSMLLHQKANTSMWIHHTRHMPVHSPKQ